MNLLPRFLTNMEDIEKNVLTPGLLRPDQQYFGETGLYAWNYIISLITIIVMAILVVMYFIARKKQKENK